MTYGFRDSSDDESVSLDEELEMIGNSPPKTENQEDEQNMVVFVDSQDSSEEEEEDNLDEEDEVVKAIKAEKNKPQDHPPTIKCDDFIVDISFHPSKNIIAVANIVGDVLFYEYSNDNTKLVNTLDVHTKACRDVEFDDEGLVMFTTAKDKAIIATDVETGQLKHCIENAHEDPVYKLLPLDSNRVVTGDDSGTVKLWDMRVANSIFSLQIAEDYISDMLTNEVQKYLVCSAGDGTLTSIDLKGSKVYSSSELYEIELTCMGLFRSETKILAGSSVGKFYLFNWKEFVLHSDEYVGRKQSIQCMIPITQNIVVSSGIDGILRAAHMFPQRQLGVVGQHSSPVEALDISHDGQYIASSSHDDDIKFWNISYFESIDNLINVNHKQNIERDMVNNLPSSSIKNASDFFSGLA